MPKDEIQSKISTIVNSIYKNKQAIAAIVKNNIEMKAELDRLSVLLLTVNAKILSQKADRLKLTGKKEAKKEYKLKKLEDSTITNSNNNKQIIENNNTDDDDAFIAGTLITGDIVGGIIADAIFGD